MLGTVGGELAVITLDLGTGLRVHRPGEQLVGHEAVGVEVGTDRDDRAHPGGVLDRQEQPEDRAVAEADDVRRLEPDGVQVGDRLLERAGVAERAVAVRRTPVPDALGGVHPVGVGEAVTERAEVLDGAVAAVEQQQRFPRAVDLVVAPMAEEVDVGHGENSRAVGW